nr:immunoglobulin heavy chain junction region [Macaca mulatta]
CARAPSSYSFGYDYW